MWLLILKGIQKAFESEVCELGDTVLFSSSQHVSTCVTSNINNFKLCKANSPEPGMGTCNMLAHIQVGLQVPPQ